LPEGILPVTDTETTAVVEIVAEGMAAEGLVPDARPTAVSQGAAVRLAGLVSPEAVDRMVADAEQSGSLTWVPAGRPPRL
jgi:hypothetical protein